MPTGYPGRTGDFDLGLGHSVEWAGPGVLIERHNYGPRGGWHSWVLTLTGGQLLAGAPGNEQALTVAGPVACPICGTAGRIIAGRWIPQPPS